MASRHPKTATVEHIANKRLTNVVYIDYLQNIYGKTLASVHSARASPFAGISTPLTWQEVHDGLKSGLAPSDFTMVNTFDRLAALGDLWFDLRTGQTADLRAVLQYAEPSWSNSHLASDARTGEGLDDMMACRAPVAQLDRAPGFEPVGRRFKSLRAHHFFRTFRRSAGVFL